MQDAPRSTNDYSLYPGVIFCDGTRRNTVPIVLSHEDANRNGVPDYSLASV